jgi:hypothetical protein
VRRPTRNASGPRSASLIGARRKGCGHEFNLLHGLYGRPTQPCRNSAVGNVSSTTCVRGFVLPSAYSRYVAGSITAGSLRPAVRPSRNTWGVYFWRLSFSNRAATGPSLTNQGVGHGLPGGRQFANFQGAVKSELISTFCQCCLHDAPSRGCSASRKGISIMRRP